MDQLRTHHMDQTRSGARARLLAGLPVNERSVKLNGIATAVLEGGEGPPIVLLHGPGAYAANWLTVIPDLATTNRVIAPDLPGHGASGSADPLDRDRVIGWLDDLIECTCPEPPVVVGQIFGAIAARFAAARSERLSHLVLADTLGLVPFQPAPEFGEALMEFTSNPTDESHDRLWSQCAFDLDALRHRLGDQWSWMKAYNLDLARTPFARAALHALMEEFGIPAIPSEELARITVPTTLIWGRHDLATPLKVAQVAASRYGWRLHVIERAADEPAMEQPEAFLKCLRSAVAEAVRP